MQKMLIRSFLLLLLLVAATTLPAQDTTVQNLYFVKNKQPLAFNQKDYVPGKSAFYLYRNCIYDLTLRNKLELRIKILDIRNDSIYYNLYKNDGHIAKERADTFSLHPRAIKKIRTNSSGLIIGIVDGHSLTKSHYVLEHCPLPKAFPRVYKTEYAQDSSSSTLYEVIPHITDYGLGHLWEKCDSTIYYFGHTPADLCPHPAVAKKHDRKNWVWFTPSNANEINGVSIGLQTMNMDNDPLTINGLNVNADIGSAYAGILVLFFIGSHNALINMPDTVSSAPALNQVRGVSVSGGGLMIDAEARGLIVNGGICFMERAHGLVLTGTQNAINDFKGMTVSLLRNKSVKGRGVQVGLINICKHLKGVQIGLWNVNSKRRLPFINWSI